MGLFSRKKKEEPAPAAGAPLKAVPPSLGLPTNTPGGAKSAPGGTKGAPVPAAAPKAVAPVVSADSAVIPAAVMGEPITFVLPDVMLEETGFIESPNSGTGSMSLVVS